jgi:hypothetical protein
MATEWIDRREQGDIAEDEIFQADEGAVVVGFFERAAGAKGTGGNI